MTMPRIAKRPRDIAICVSACLQEGDLDGITALFHPECQIFFPPGQPPHTGLAGARAVFEEFITIRPHIKSQIISEVIVGDIALLRANWSVVAPDGTVLGEGQSTEVARKLENGGWGYLIDCPLGPPNFVVTGDLEGAKAHEKAAGP
ncbi:MAG: nuclear transport factor 2 family protein [Roseibium sp.]